MQHGSVVALISHGTYVLSHQDRGLPQHEMTDENGLQLHPDAGDEGGAVAFPGTFFGPVELAVEVHVEEPEEPSGWDYTQALEMEAVGQNLAVATLTESFDDLPMLIIAPGEKYGVRVSARGVDAAAERQELGPDEAPLEHHLIQLWPVV